MSKNNTPNQNAKMKLRKPYQKPHIEQVKLVLEEAVLADNCKFIAAGTGPERQCFLLGGTGQCLVFGT